MFTPNERASLRAELLERAAHDARISSAAITGSLATGREDRWSDIDLAFAVHEPAILADVLADWTEFLYASHAALAHFDVRHGAWIYRVFLLANTLQVDLAFVPSSDFRALAPSFRLVFGEARKAEPLPAAAPGDLIGYLWLYALHSRGCLARGKRWQAEYMISAMRDSALALACLRHNLPAVHGGGFDQLPGEVLARFKESFVEHLEDAELWRAFRTVTEGSLQEIRYCDAQLAARLENALTEMAEGPALIDNPTPQL